MGKIKVPKEVASAIEFVKNEHGYDFRKFMAVLSTDNFRVIKEGKPLNTFPIERVALALLLGYEVEEDYFENKKMYAEELKSKGMPELVIINEKILSK